MRNRWRLAAVGIAVAAGTGGPAHAAGQQDLSSLTIEELAQIPVRSASKRAEPLSGAPTALYVITNEAIARSAATSLPEALRLAPNLQVQQVNAAQYAISARGFNGIEASNKLLVLIDGRSVYSTLHSGVFWELHAPLLEDIDQIEVVSGPGGTLYGPNAVNGVINVISRDAHETQGLLVRGTVGGEARTGAARIGWRMGDRVAMRAYVDYFDREDAEGFLGRDPDDAFRGWQAGARADIDGDAGHLTLQGDVFDNDTFLEPGDGNKGHNLLGRWSHRTGTDSAVEVQGYYDYSERRAERTIDRLATLDVQSQFTLNTGGHALVAGVGVRTTRDQVVNFQNDFQLDPQRDRLWMVNFFGQDRFEFAPDWSVIAGLKLESSSFSGLEALPNLRLAWQPSEKALFWAAVSRAVRTPSRIDRDLSEPELLVKAPDFASEKLIAFEAGYRGRPFGSTSLSVSLFYNHYDDLRTIGLNDAGTAFQLRNDLAGHTYGLEAWATQQVAPWWRLSAGAALLGKKFNDKPGTIDFASGVTLGRDADHQFSLRSQMTLPRGVTLDAGLRAVGALDTPRIPAYAEADARIGMRLTDNVEFYLAGENLLHAHHLEGDQASRAQRIARSVYAGTRLRF